MRKPNNSRSRDEPILSETKKDEDDDHVHYHGVDSVERHISVDDALKEFLAGIEPVKAETIPSLESFQRVLYEDVAAPVDVPARARSTRDGYALQIPDSSNNKSPIEFKIVGDVRIGTVPNIKLYAGEAARVATGSYLPSGANSVVMIEYLKELDGSRIELEREPKVGENILSRGEDLEKGMTILGKGLRLEATHIALLAQLGRKRIRAFRKPTISFFSTGDELFDPFKTTNGLSTRIPDINRPFIRSMIVKLNAKPLDLGIAKDSYEGIRRRIERGLKSSDALILSAGSSVGERDYALKAAKSIPGVNILVHGVAMRPSSPTGLALHKGKPFVLLPGFPTSALMSFYVFARAAIMKLSGEKTSGELQPIVRARMLDDFKGRSGVKHFLRVRVTKGDNGSYTATIVKPTEAYYSSWLGKANGIAILDKDGTEIHSGDDANVFLIGSTE